MALQLDKRDRRILAALQRDARMSNADLAALVGMSASACWRRVRSLEEAGVIEGYGARINPRRVGLDFAAVVHVHLARHDAAAVAGFIRTIAARPEVLECYATTGHADYHLRVVCRDLDAYNRFLDEVLFCEPAVQSAQTNLVLRDIKRSAILDMPG